MPKETFLNLSDEKQERIREIAFEEFGMHAYKSASINRIVDKAGIAKGSIYQYFDNKKDLYQYLIEISAQIKFEYIHSMVNQDEIEFFAIFKQMLYAGVLFDIHRPKYSKLLLNVTFEKHDAEVKDIAHNLRNISYEFIRQVVFQGQVEGYLRTDTDTDFLVFILYTMAVELESYFKTFHQFSLQELVNAGISEMPLDETEIKSIVDRLIDVLATGFGPKNQVSI